jgi:hypothetical protein
MEGKKEPLCLRRILEFTEKFKKPEVPRMPASKKEQKGNRKIKEGPTPSISYKFIEKKNNEQDSQVAVSVHPETGLDSFMDSRERELWEEEDFPQKHDHTGYNRKQNRDASEALQGQATQDEVGVSNRSRVFLV